MLAQIKSGRAVCFQLCANIADEMADDRSVRRLLRNEQSNAIKTHSPSGVRSGYGRNDNQRQMGSNKGSPPLSVTGEFGVGVSIERIGEDGGPCLPT